MYLPKYLKAYIPAISLDRNFIISNTYYDDILPCYHRAWKEINNWIMRDNDKNSATNPFVNWHRGSHSMFGDQGYFRLGAFINILLHSMCKGRLVYHLLPDARDRVVINADLVRDADDSIGNMKLALSQEDQAVIDFFYNLPALNQLNAKMIRIDELKENILKLGNMTYVTTEDIGSTLLNTLIFYTKVIILLWLEPYEVDSDTIKVIYTEFDPADCLLKNDLDSFFQADMLSHDMSNLIKSITDLSLIGRDNSFDSNGFHLLDSFFTNFSNAVFQTAFDLSVRIYDISTRGRAFLSEFPKYSSIVRLKLNSSFVKHSLMGGSECLIYTNTLQDVDVSESNIVEFITHFETLYGDLISMWAEFVNKYFVKIQDVSNLGAPLLSGYYAEVNGVNLIYGLKYTAPYAYNGFFITKFKDGFEIDDIKVNSTGKNKDRLIKTRVIDETFRGVSTIDYVQTCAPLRELLIRAKLNLVISRKSLTEEIYSMKFDDYLGVIIPPTNPVSNFKIDSSIIDFGVTGDPELYTMALVHRDKITYEMLPFIVKAADFSRSHNSIDPDKALASLYEQTFTKSLSADAIGYHYYLGIVNVGRAAVLSMSALLATRDLVASENALKYLQISVDESNLEPRFHGIDLVIERNIHVPFPISLKELSQDQIRVLRENHSKKIFQCFKGMNTKSDLLVNESINIDASLPYSIFSDEYKMGVAEVHLGRNLYPEQLEYVSKNDKQWVYRINSLLDKISPDAISRGAYFNEVDANFYDPFPNLNPSDASLYLLLVALSDFMLDSTYSRISSHNQDCRYPAGIIAGVVNFWKDCFNPKGRVVQSANFDIDKTWGDLTLLLEDAYNMSCAVILDPDGAGAEVTFSNLRKAFIEGLRNFRDKHPIFWSSSGFKLLPMYFGDTYCLLRSKYAGETRKELVIPHLLDVKYIPTPPVLNSAVSSSIRGIILSNLNIMMYNTLGKAYYGARHDSTQR